MKEISELEAMKSIDDAMSAVSDPSTRVRILRWAWSKFSPSPTAPIEEEEPDGSKAKTKKKGKKARKPVKSKKTSRTMLKDLNLKPSGTKSFKDFAAEKKPGSNLEKCVVAVYYVERIIKKGPVSADHVFTCFKAEGWRVPSDLDNTLQYVASQKAWIDTRDMSDIKVTTHGENLIEHDLPKAEKKGSK
jgi:hypothetical protein